jgi:hypothetical protein
MEESDPNIPALPRIREGLPFKVLLGEKRRLTFLSMDNEVCLAWLADMLQQLRQDGQTKAACYLEAVLEEVVFEAKTAPR